MSDIGPEQPPTYHPSTYEGFGDTPSGPNFCYPGDPAAAGSQETAIVADIPDVVIDQSPYQPRQSEGTYRLLPAVPALGAALLLSTVSWIGYGGVADRAHSLADEAFATARVEISRSERIEVEIGKLQETYPRSSLEVMQDRAATSRYSAFMHDAEGVILTGSAIVSDAIPIGSTLVIAFAALEATSKRRYVIDQ